MKVKAFSGIMLTLFLVVTLFAAIPIVATPGWDGEIKIAVVGPQGWIQWDGLWVGTTLAAELINLGPNGQDDGGDGDDGIIIGGANYKVVLVPVDSHAVPEPEPAAGWAELFAALEGGADYVLGGFRTECVAPMRLNFLQYAAAKDGATGYAPIWTIAGASTDELVDCRDAYGNPTAACGGTCVACNYDLGKYMFRATPMRGTWLFRQIAAFVRSWALPFKLGPIYGGSVVGSDAGAGGVPVYANPVKTVVVCEDLTWSESIGAATAGNEFVSWSPYPTPPSPYSVIGPNADVVGYYRTHALTPNFEPLFNFIDSQNVRLVIHIYSAVTGIDFIKTWKERGTEAVCVGINVESQMQAMWDNVGGKCEYESFLATVGTRTNLNPDAKPLSTAEVWDLYYDRSGDILTDFWGSPMPNTYPVYTMWGSYDWIIALNETLSTLGSWPQTAAAKIALMEATNRTGLMGQFRYSDLTVPGDGKGHDLYCDPSMATPYWPEPHWVRAPIPQWQDGAMEIVFPRDQDFSRRYIVPPWMYSLAETDVANVAGFGSDGDVGVYDIGMVGAAWLTTHGVTGWNIEVDMDNNGVINIFDASRVAKDWLKSWSTEGYPSWPLP